MAMTAGSQHIPESRRLSPVRVLRIVCDLVTQVAQYSGLRINLCEALAECVIADESSRSSSKTSKDYPRKKRRRQTGAPTVTPINADLLMLALQRAI
jgi:hypothetical protein